MTRLPPGSPEFSALFGTFQHTAYRLELLQHYAEPAEVAARAEFALGREPQVYPGKAAWVRLVSDAAAAGKIMQRVHVVTEPLSDYLRYEIGWSYQVNARAGEDIRILPGHLAAAGLPGQDYWLFDSRTLARMAYTDGGRMTGVELVSDPAVIVEACYWRDAALHAAVPLARYGRVLPYVS